VEGHRLNKEQLLWSKIAPGVWRAVIGSPAGLHPLAVVNERPQWEALRRMGDPPFPLPESAIEAENGAAGKIVRFPLHEQEKVYGMGLQFMRMNQRGRTRYLRVNSDPKQDTGESHAPVPFFVTDRGYGVLVNTSRIVTIHCGSTVRLQDTRKEDALDRNTDRRWRATPLSAWIEIVLPAEGAELLLFAGHSALEAVRRYNLYSGGGALPPRWGLGFWHRVPKLFNAQEVLDEAMEFRKRDFPCDVIGLEPGWHSRSYPVTYEWSAERFPDPASFVKRMEEQGFRVNLWEHPYVSPESGLYEPLRPLSGSYTVWGGLAPDYSLREARALYERQHEREHVEIGVSGYKLDECDGSELTGHSWMFPAHAQFPSGHDGEQMRQLYGLMFQRMTADLFRRRGRRTYGLVRASGAGAAPLPYVLYSDLYDHRQFVRALCNASFSGLLWTPEVRRAKDAEDWARRMQTVVFSPLAMLNAWGDGTKPWSYPEVEGVIRHYIKLRMRLMPYLYSEFARYHFEGIPPFRAMPLVDRTAAQAAKEGGVVENTTDAAYGKARQKEWDDQYMVGDSLLVAPLFAGETERDVYLPAGVWYGLETGERFEGGTIVRVEAGIERIPVFVREGAIIPMMPALPRAPRPGETVPLDIVHFGNAPGEYLLYDDDGETLAYERGEYVFRKIEVFRDEGGKFSARISDVREPQQGTDRGLAHSSYGPVNWHLCQTCLPFPKES